MLSDTTTSKPGSVQTALQRGYVAAAGGALGAGIAGGTAVGGTAFVLMPCEDRGFDCLGVALVAIGMGILGGLLSAVAGCYGALTLRGHERAGRTAAIFAALLPAAVAVSVGLAGLLTVFGPVLGIAGAAVAARRLAIGKPISEDIHKEA